MATVLNGCFFSGRIENPRSLEEQYADTNPQWKWLQENIVKDFAGIEKDGEWGLIIYKKRDPQKQKERIAAINKYINEQVYERSNHKFFIIMLPESPESDQYFIRIHTMFIHGEACYREPELSYANPKAFPYYSVKMVNP